MLTVLCNRSWRSSFEYPATANTSIYFSAGTQNPAKVGTEK